jgi:hypothetical protein
VFEILHGLHGLQTYANQYWHKHILAYMELVVSQKLDVPEYLVPQLDEILKYRKSKPPNDLTKRTPVETSKDQVDVDQIHPSLVKFPELNSLIASSEQFRNGLKNQDWSQKHIDSR